MVRRYVLDCCCNSVDFLETKQIRKALPYSATSFFCPVSCMLSSVAPLIQQQRTAAVVLYADQLPAAQGKPQGVAFPISWKERRQAKKNAVKSRFDASMINTANSVKDTERNSKAKKPQETFFACGDVSIYPQQERRKKSRFAANAGKWRNLAASITVERLRRIP